MLDNSYIPSLILPERPTKFRKISKRTILIDRMLEFKIDKYRRNFCFISVNELFHFLRKSSFIFDRQFLKYLPVHILLLILQFLNESNKGSPKGYYNAYAIKSKEVIINHEKRILNSSQFIREVFGYFQRDKYRNIYLIRKDLIFQGVYSGLKERIPLFSRSLVFFRVIGFGNDQIEEFRELSLVKLSLVRMEGIGGLFLTKLLRRLRNLENLKIQNIYSLTTENIESIAFETGITNLQIFDCEVTNKYCDILLQSTTIRILGLFSNSITSDGLIRLKVNDTLVKLGIDDNEIKDLGVKYITLSKSLRVCNVKNCGTSEIALYLLLHNKMIRKLILGKVNFLGIKKLDYKKFFEEGKFLTNELEVINFSETFVPFRIIRILSKILKLSYLCLSSCNVEDKSVEVICQMKSLKRLTLANNLQLTTLSVEYLSKNKSIEELYYSFNKINNEDAIMLLGMKNLKELHIACTPVNESIIGGLDCQQLEFLNIFNTNFENEMAMMYLQLRSDLKVLVYGKGVEKNKKWWFREN